MGSRGRACSWVLAHATSAEVLWSKTSHQYASPSFLVVKASVGVFTTWFKWGDSWEILRWYLRMVGIWSRHSLLSLTLAKALISVSCTALLTEWGPCTIKHFQGEYIESKGKTSKFVLYGLLGKSHSVFSDIKGESASLWWQRCCDSFRWHRSCQMAQSLTVENKFTIGEDITRDYL